MDFLQAVGQHYLQTLSGDNWSHIHFVFPSHRAGLFFRDALRAQLGQRTIFGLNILTISDFVQRQAKLTVADRLTLIFELYDVYKDVFGAEKADIQGFEFFYSWAPTFISDFSDIDKYLIDARQIFTNAKQYEAYADDFAHLTDTQRQAILDFWSVAFRQPEEGESIFQQRFNDTYEHLYDFYTSFRNALRLKGLAYDGMAYRDVAELYASGQADDSQDKYVFIGFNALCSAEQLIMRRLRDSGRAEFFWDYNDDILRPIAAGDEHGAGRFLRSLVKEFPHPKGFVIPQPAQLPEFQSISFAYPQGQVAGVVDFLQKHYSDTSPERTAIVLADENMLLPVISALPADIANVNITMGYPLRQSQLSGLVDLLAKLQASADDKTFYARCVIAVLKHTCVASEQALEMAANIVKNNKIRVPADELCVSPLLSSIFRRAGVDSLPDYLHEVFSAVYERYCEGNELLRECAFEMLKAINHFRTFVDRAAGEVTDVKFLFRIFQSITSTLTVDFCGVPLCGLQIMGILEARVVDFDNIVVLDVNEGVMTKSANSNSFIPSLLRRSFGLPTYDFRDSISAYYFFRLVSRAKHVTLLYTTSGNENAKGVSRFLLQLLYQYRRPIQQRVATHDIVVKSAVPQPISKTPEMLDRLQKSFSKGILSPTTLTTYLKCPKQLYYKKILNLDSENNLVEDLEGNNFGNIFHHVLEELYQTSEGKVLQITKELKNKLLSSQFEPQLHTLLCKYFSQELGSKISSRADLEGKNLLLYDMLLDYIRKAIRREPEGVVVTHCERKVRTTYTTSSGYEINLGGTIDRMHNDAGRQCVLDYKTGSVDEKVFTPTKSIQAIFEDKKLDCKELIQVLFYCYILKQMGEKGELYTQNLSMAKLQSNDYTTQLLDAGGNALTYDAVAADFEEQLRQTIDEMFNPDIPFAPARDLCTSSSSTCTYCNYTNLCRYSAQQ